MEEVDLDERTALMKDMVNDGGCSAVYNWGWLPLSSGKHLRLLADNRALPGLVYARVSTGDNSHAAQRSARCTVGEYLWNDGGLQAKATRKLTLLLSAVRILS